MSIESFKKNKKKFYQSLIILINAYLIFLIALLFIYLIAPLLGGKFLARAVFFYGSWIVYSLVMKFTFNKIRQEIKFKPYEYAIINLITIICFTIWFSYPLNVVINVIYLLISVYCYKKLCQ